jgi:hypothetical protein
VSVLVNKPERRLEPVHPQEERPEHPQKTVGRCARVAELLRPKHACGVRAILPRPEDRGLPRTRSALTQVPF